MKRLIAGFVALLVLIFGLIFVPALHQETTTITVTDKDRVCSGSGSSTSCTYLVYTEQGTFENSDSVLDGKFDSSDVQGRFKVGETYTVRVRGYRIPFLSSYQNIVEVR